MSAETILVVDDGKENRDFIVEYVLKPNGFHYLIARDGREGLKQALHHHPDLMLLDLQMPNMNGIQVLEALATHNIDLPVVLMTFHGSEEIAIEVYRLGVKDYVKKPYSADEMLTAIERSLSEVRLRREKEALTTRLLEANRTLQRRLQELNILYNIGKHVTSTMNIRALLPRIVDAAAEITRAEEGYIALIENKKLVCRARKGTATEHAQAIQEEITDPIVRHVLKSRVAVALGPDKLSRLNAPASPHSAAYAPLMLRGRVLGVLGVFNVTPGSEAFTRDDSNLLSALGDYASIALENSHNYEAVRASRQRVRDTFERFVPPSVVQQALTQPEGIQLGGTRQEISVLFADIRGYTSWSENAPPEQVVVTLNDYLSLAAEVILGWEGTLDKFMGDGLMAIFNAPHPQPDHVHRAADAALALMRAAHEIKLMHGHKLSYSIGVNVGEAIVGYIGTERALNYTAIGDTVNLTKRLQEYGSPGQILVNESVVQRLGSQITVRPVGELQVKGRKTPSMAYELLDLR